MFMRDSKKSASYHVKRRIPFVRPTAPVLEADLRRAAMTKRAKEAPEVREAMRKQKGGEEREKEEQAVFEEARREVGVERRRNNLFLNHDLIKPERMLEEKESQPYSWRMLVPGWVV